MDGKKRGDFAENRIGLKQVQETRRLRVHREDGRCLTVCLHCETPISGVSVAVRAFVGFR